MQDMGAGPGKRGIVWNTVRNDRIFWLVFSISSVIIEWFYGTARMDL
jgi:hypothetical protein